MGPTVGGAAIRHRRIPGRLDGFSASVIGMDPVAVAFSGGWASGVNAYLTVLVLGVIERYTDLGVVPDVFGEPVVLAVAGFMALVELVVDKVPWVDSAWDAVSTVVRPLVGALVAYQFAADAEVSEVLLTLLGGGTALASHAVKSGLRLGVNTSPEPFSNAAVSTAEDIGVVTVASLAVASPWVALGVSAVLLLGGAALVVVLLGAIRRGLRARTARHTTRPRGTPD